MTDDADMGLLMALTSMLARRWLDAEGDEAEDHNGTLRRLVEAAHARSITLIERAKEDAEANAGDDDDDPDE